MLNSRYRRRPTTPFAGGHGSVQLYDDVLLERVVAVKTLHAGTDSRRLLDEIAALGAVKSKHVVQVYDVHVESVGTGSEISLIQEFVDGDTLSEFIGPHVSMSDAVGLLYQLSVGLAEVHRFGITHRDIKPENVRIDTEGILKLLDFGLARFESRQSTVGIVGTPGFMAPELRRFGHVEFSSAVDVFAFGVTAWCLFAEQSDPAAIAPDEMSFEDFAISGPLAQILRRTIANLPENRPSIAEVSELLARELLHNAHRATVITPTEIAIMDATQSKVSLSVAGLGECEIVYDGFEFWIDRISGDVYVNNSPVAERRRLEGSMLITLGSQASGRRRIFVPFDVSHPDVTY